MDTIALSEFYLHLWLWMNLLVILKFICIYVLSIYLYELSVMPIMNYLWWMWCLFECGTWLWPNQINWLYVVALPSVTLGKRDICRVPWKIHSAKRDTWQKSMHSGTKMASLSSVCAMTLSKEANICTLWASVCRVSIIWHSTNKAGLLSVRYLTLDKEGGLSSVPEFDTRQRRQLCQVSQSLTLSKEGSFAKC